MVMLFSSLLSAVGAALTAVAPARTVLAVPVIAQAYNLSCEAASLQMALGFEGVRIGQTSLLKLMRPDYARPDLSGGRVVGWGDPYANFVGDPSGHEYNSTGYGVYYPVVAQAAATAGGAVAWSGTGLTWTRLTDLVRDHHPVVAWVAFDGVRYAESGPFYEYVAWDGRRVPFGPGFEHAVVIAGISADAVLVNNPRWGYQEWLPRQAFLDAFAVFGRMAVALG
jgi:uncharacterized protein YvpB